MCENEHQQNQSYDYSAKSAWVRSTYEGPPVFGYAHGTIRGNIRNVDNPNAGGFGTTSK